MKHEGFTPIGQTAVTATRQNPTGAGNNAGRGGAVASLADTHRVAAWLARHSPADMDRAALSRASQHGVGLRVKFEHRFPSGPNGEYLPSYSVAVACEIGPEGDRAAALADLRNFMVPASPRDIEGWLSELSVTVAKRQDDAFSEELRLTTYAARLGQYPADVARTVLRQTYQFWPTWAELEKRCEALTGPRRHMIAALERGPEPPEPKRRPPTDEERARIQAMIDEMFPSRDPAERAAAVNEALRGNCMSDPE